MKPVYKVLALSFQTLLIHDWQTPTKPKRKTLRIDESGRAKNEKYIYENSSTLTCDYDLFHCRLLAKFVPDKALLLINLLFELSDSAAHVNRLSRGS